MGISKSFDIKNLLPFHKAGSGVPGGIRGVRGEAEEIDQLDPNLSTDEQMYVRHYLGYADILLASPPDEMDSPAAHGDSVIEMPRNRNQEQPAQQEAKKEEGSTEAA
jgi:hypothetical protein